MPTYNAQAALPGGEPGPWGDATTITYDQRDVLLYALGLGINDLRYVYEGHDAYAVFPTFPIRWGWEGLVMDPAHIPPSPAPLSIDAERYLSVQRPLPLEGQVFVRSRLLSAHPRKNGAAFVECESVVEDADGNAYLNMINGAYFRGVEKLGDIEAFEGAGELFSTALPTPDQAPDLIIESHLDAALAKLYRLSGDDNPLHIDPAAAQFGGFDRPILHGLCTYGHCAYRLLAELADGDASRFQSIRVRFTAPVYPGDHLTIRAWHDGPGRVLFNALVDDTVVVGNAVFEYTPD